MYSNPAWADNAQRRSDFKSEHMCNSGCQRCDLIQSVVHLSRSCAMPAGIKTDGNCCVGSALVSFSSAPSMPFASLTIGCLEIQFKRAFDRSSMTSRRRVDVDGSQQWDWF